MPVAGCSAIKTIQSRWFSHTSALQAQYRKLVMPAKVVCSFSTGTEPVCKGVLFNQQILVQYLLLTTRAYKNTYMSFKKLPQCFHHTQLLLLSYALHSSATGTKHLTKFNFSEKKSNKHPWKLTCLLIHTIKAVIVMAPIYTLVWVTSVGWHSYHVSQNGFQQQIYKRFWRSRPEPKYF